MEYETNNRGTLGKNKDKKTDKHPDYRGQVDVEGVDYWVSGWIQTNKSTGEKFFSLALTKKDEQKQALRVTEETAASQDGDFSDDIPF